MALFGIPGQKRPDWLKRLVLGDATLTPYYAPLFIKPSAAPTKATQGAGAIYIDSTTHSLGVHDGTTYRFMDGYVRVPVAWNLNQL